MANLTVYFLKCSNLKSADRHLALLDNCGGPCPANINDLKFWGEGVKVAEETTVGPGGNTRYVVDAHLNPDSLV
jgi:hypothetical protein